MKHARRITKAAPAPAYWWGWFTKFGELISSGAKATYINQLWITNGTLDPRDV